MSTDSETLIHIMRLFKVVGISIAVVKLHRNKKKRGTHVWNDVHLHKVLFFQVMTRTQIDIRRTMSGLGIHTFYCAVCLFGPCFMTSMIV